MAAPCCRAPQLAAASAGAHGLCVARPRAAAWPVWPEAPACSSSGRAAAGPGRSGAVCPGAGRSAGATPGLRCAGPPLSESFRAARTPPLHCRGQRFAAVEGDAGAIPELDAEDTPEPAPVAGATGPGGDPVRALVESSMMAALSGLTFYLASLFRLEAYAGAFFPLPLVVVAFRWGLAAAARTLLTTFLLLCVLGGPLRAVSYVLLHGSLGYVLCVLWTRQAPWALSVPLAAAVRSAGIAGSLLLTSWLLRENVLTLVVAQTVAMLDQICAVAGLPGAPSPGAVRALLAALVAGNALIYIFLLHVLYSILLQPLARLEGLRNRNAQAGRPPAFIRKLIFA